MSKRPQFHAHGAEVLGKGLRIAALTLLVFPAAASAADATKQAFLERKAMYVTFEITETGSREFDEAKAKDAITDGAYRVNNSVRVEVPLDMPSPGGFPPSSMPMSTEEMLEPGRFITWIAMPPDMGEAAEALTTGQIDMAKNPMFLPVEYSVDKESRFRFRDTPSQGWGTQTESAKGHGTAYIARSGMIGCDLKKMTYDINNVLLNYNSTELIEVTTTSDVSGFEEKHETGSPDQMLPSIPQTLAGKLAAIPLTLSDPSTFSFSGPAGDTGAGPGSTVTVKITLSAHPAAKAGQPARAK